MDRYYYERDYLDGLGWQSTTEEETRRAVAGRYKDHLQAWSRLFAGEEVRTRFAIYRRRERRAELMWDRELESWLYRGRGENTLLEDLEYGYLQDVPAVQAVCDTYGIEPDQVDVYDHGHPYPGFEPEPPSFSERQELVTFSLRDDKVYVHHVAEFLTLQAAVRYRDRLLELLNKETQDGSRRRTMHRLGGATLALLTCLLLLAGCYVVMIGWK